MLVRVSKWDTTNQCLNILYTLFKQNSQKTKKKSPKTKPVTEHWTHYLNYKRRLGVCFCGVSAPNYNCQKGRKHDSWGLPLSHFLPPSVPKLFIFQSQLQTRSLIHLTRLSLFFKSMHCHWACKKSQNLFFQEIPERRLLYIWSLLYRHKRTGANQKTIWRK